MSLTLKASVVMGLHVSLAPTMCSSVPQRDLEQMKRQAANQVTRPVSAHCPNGFRRGIFYELFLLLKFPIRYNQILLARKSRNSSKIDPRWRIKRLPSQVRLACAQLCGIVLLRRESWKQQILRLHCSLLICTASAPSKRVMFECGSPSSLA